MLAHSKKNIVIKLFIRFITLSSFLLLFVNAYSQKEDEFLDKLYKKDSAESIKAEKIYSQNIVTNEIHNTLFHNIYKTKSGNEEEFYHKEVERLKEFDTKIIDTIILIQIDVFGPTVYNPFQKSNGIEKFLSHTLHVNTRKNILKNRYLLFKKGDLFSPYRATENMRLVRKSGVIHDMRMSPEYEEDSNRIALYIYVQDVFPYGVSDFGLSGTSGYRLGIENVNLFGLTHQIRTKIEIKPKSPVKTVGAGLEYKIPNVLKKQFVDISTRFGYYERSNFAEVGMIREFSRPEFRWAGGAFINYGDISELSISGSYDNSEYVGADLWVSRLFPFKYTNATTNGLIAGLRYYNKTYLERPPISPTSRYYFWNQNLMLLSVGYSRYLFIQDRLINGFGKTEDIPNGFSLNGIYGLNISKFANRSYFGVIFQSQFYALNNFYTYLNTEIGVYANKYGVSESVGDFQFQFVSPSYRIGNFRLRNYLKSRFTVGINQDSVRYISLNEYDGIRGINNSSYKGDSRLTGGFQSNLFLPFSLLGFRFSIFGLFELAKIQYGFKNMVNTPFLFGLTGGISFKNENLIFEVIQLQYGYYPNTSYIGAKGFSITSILPFRFNNIDISKPNTVKYE